MVACMEEITLVIVDDHPLFRQGVIDTLSMEPDLHVIGQATNGDEGLQVIRDKQPLVAIIDVNLPGLNGQQLTRQIINEKIPTRILLLTAYDDTEQQLHALRVGASAYCTKDVRPEELVKIVRTVIEGKYVISDRVLERGEVENWLDTYTDPAIRQIADLGEPFQPLSAREMEVLIHISKGMSNKEIAVALGISHQTVKNHVTAILRKLGVDDRTQATVYALRRGWVRLHDGEQSKQE